MRPTAHPSALTRQNVGLTEAHRELIKLLAEKTVSDFLAETDEIDTNAPAERDEAAR